MDNFLTNIYNSNRKSCGAVKKKLTLPAGERAGDGGKRAQCTGDSAVCKAAA